MIEPQVPSQPTDVFPDDLSQSSNTLANLETPLLVSDMIVPIHPVETQEQNKAPNGLFQARMSGLDKLMSVKSALVKQKFNLLPTLTGCQGQNDYSIYGLSEDGKTNQYSKMFKCKEKANICAKQFCGPQCRGFKMDVNHRDYFDKDFDNESFLYFSRSFQCTTCCFGRPEVEVEWNEGGRRVILGKIKDPQSFCHLKMEVYDAVGSMRYLIQGSGCQFGVICEAECCSKVKLSIRNSSDMEVGTLSRINGISSEGCCKSVTNFAINFPVLANAEDRALLTVATLLIDYMYFEKRFAGICPINCLGVCL